MTCFDIDERTLSSLNKDFLLATESEIICSDSIVVQAHKVAVEIPIALYLPKIRVIENIVRAYPKQTRNVNKVALYATKVREFFLNFLLIDLLDYKNCDYSHEEVYLLVNRKKKLPKDHYEYIKAFTKTHTFKKFQQKIRKCNTPEEQRLDKILKYYSKEKKPAEEEVVDTRETLEIDQHLKRVSYDQLQEMYYKESNFLPAKQSILSFKDNNKAKFYRYTYVPKLLTSLTETNQAISKINWPPIYMRTTKIGFLRDIFNPEQYYTHENIKDAIWLACWMGTYWYHENKEKRIHILQLIMQLPSMKFTSRQREIILSQVIDNLEVFGKTHIAAENLSYFIH